MTRSSTCWSTAASAPTSGSWRSCRSGRCSRRCWPLRSSTGRASGPAGTRAGRRHRRGPPRPCADPSRRAVRRPERRLPPPVPRAPWPERPRPSGRSRDASPRRWPRPVRAHRPRPSTCPILRPSRRPSPARLRWRRRQRHRRTTKTRPPTSPSAPLPVNARVGSPVAAPPRSGGARRHAASWVRPTPRAAAPDRHRSPGPAIGPRAATRRPYAGRGGPGPHRRRRRAARR